jgi:hypothetical protein
MSSHHIDSFLSDSSNYVECPFLTGDVNSGRGNSRGRRKGERCVGIAALRHTEHTKRAMTARAKSNESGDNLVAGELYYNCLEAKPMMGSEWFSARDTGCRLGLAVIAFYRFMLTEPFALLRFAYGWNRLWYGRIIGTIMTFFTPVAPFVLSAAELVKRAGEHMPWAKPDWKMEGPGRVFFTRPPSLIGSLLWDFYLSISAMGMPGTPSPRPEMCTLKT